MKYDVVKELMYRYARVLTPSLSLKDLTLCKVGLL